MGCSACAGPQIGQDVGDPAERRGDPWQRSRIADLQRGPTRRRAGQSPPGPAAHRRPRRTRWQAALRCRSAPAGAWPGQPRWSRRARGAGAPATARNPGTRRTRLAAAAPADRRRKRGRPRRGRSWRAGTGSAIRSKISGARRRHRPPPAGLALRAWTRSRFRCRAAGRAARHERAVRQPGDPDPPAANGHALAERGGHDRAPGTAVAGLRHGRRRIVHQVTVDLVGDDDQVVPRGDLAQPAYGRWPGQRAGRVVGQGDDHRADRLTGPRRCAGGFVEAAGIADPALPGRARDEVGPGAGQALPVPRS